MPRSGIAGPCSSSIFKFLGTATLFSIAAAPFYIPNNSAQEFQLSSPMLIFCLKKKVAILMRVKWYFIMGFDLYFPSH